MKIKNKGDVWISTVLYTLIGLAIVGSMVAILQPRVSELKDKFVIEQTVQSLNILDNTIQGTREAAGTRLNYIINMERGNLVIDSPNEEIYWEMDSKYQYSKENEMINLSVLGRLKALTVKKEGAWDVKLILDYKTSNVDITVNGRNDVKTIQQSSLPYSIWITNKGLEQVTRLQQIDLSVE